MDELTPEQLQELDTNIKGMLDGGGSQADVEKYASDYREFIKKKAKEAPSKTTTAHLQDGGQPVSSGTTNGSTVKSDEERLKENPIVGSVFKGKEAPTVPQINIGATPQEETQAPVVDFGLGKFQEQQLAQKKESQQQEPLVEAPKDFNVADVLSKLPKSQLENQTSDEIEQIGLNLESAYRNIPADKLKDKWKVDDEVVGMLPKFPQNSQDNVGKYLKTLKDTNPNEWNKLKTKLEIGDSKEVQETLFGVTQDVLNKDINQSANDAKILQQRGDTEGYNAKLEQYNKLANDYNETIKRYPIVNEEVIKQNEYEQWLKENPIKGQTLESAKKLYNIIPKTLGSTLRVANLGKDFLLGATNQDVNSYDFTDRMIDQDINFLDKVTANTSQRPLFENGTLNKSAIAPTVVEGLGNMMMLMYGGNYIANPLMESGLAVGTADAIGLTASGFITQYGDYYQTAKDLKLTDSEASKYAASSALANSLLENINPNFKFLNAKKVINQTMIDMIEKGVEPTVGGMLKSGAGNILQENAQEFSQLLMDKASNFIANQNLGQNTFNTGTTGDEIKETALTTTLVTALAGSAEGLMSKSQRNVAQYSLAKKFAADPLSVTDAITTQINNKSITQEQGDALLKSISDKAKVIKTIPPEKTDEEKIAAIPIIEEINDLEKKKDNSHEIFQQEFDELIKKKKEEAMKELFPDKTAPKKEEKQAPPPKEEITQPLTEEQQNIVDFHREMGDEDLAKQAEQQFLSINKTTADTQTEVTNESLNKNKTNELSQPIRQEELGGGKKILSREQEAKDYIRGSIEASPEKLQGQREIKDAEKKSALKYAEENNLWVDDLNSLGKPMYGGGNEHSLVYDENTNSVYKANNLFNSGDSITEYLDNIQNHNAVFPDNKYELVGFTGLKNEGTKRPPYIEPIVKQDFVYDAEQASHEEIQQFMEKKEYKPTGKEGEYTNGEYTVSDLFPRNVLIDKNGNIHVIDDIVRKNKSESSSSKKTNTSLEDNATPIETPKPKVEELVENSGEEKGKKIYVHETDSPTFEKFDVNKIGSGQGDQWLGRGIYLQEKGGFKLETYGKNKIETTLKDGAKIFTVKETPDGEYRNNFVEWAVKNDIGNAKRLAKEASERDVESDKMSELRGLKKDKRYTSKKNILPRDILRNSPDAVEKLKEEGYDGLEQDGELVIYNPDVLEIKKSQPKEQPTKTTTKTEVKKSEPEPKTSTETKVQKTIDDAQYKPRHKNGVLVRLPIDFVLDNQEQGFKVERGKNEIGSRIDKAKKFLESNPKDLEASDIYIKDSGKDKGKIGFGDGRHRLIAAKELGATHAYFELPATKEQFDALNYLLSEFGNEKGIDHTELYSTQGDYKLIQTSDNTFLLNKGNDVYTVKLNEAGGFDNAEITKNGKNIKGEPNLLLAVQNHLQEINPESNARNINKFLGRDENAPIPKLEKTSKKEQKEIDKLIESESKTSTVSESGKEKVESENISAISKGLKEGKTMDEVVSSIQPKKGKIKLTVTQPFEVDSKGTMAKVGDVIEVKKKDFENYYVTKHNGKEVQSTWQRKKWVLSHAKEFDEKIESENAPKQKSKPDEVVVEKPIENKGKEIEPHKEVSKSVQKAIDDVLKNGVGTGGIKPMEAQMLYTAFKDLDLNQYHIDNENGSTLNVGDKGLKGQIFKKLEEKGFVSDLGVDGDSYTITDSGKAFVEKVQGRVETRRGVKEGWDLFPEEANIPELKAKVKELKTVTDGKTIKKFGGKTESEIKELEPVVENLESEGESANKVEELEKVISDADKLLQSESETVTPSKPTVTPEEGRVEGTEADLVKQRNEKAKHLAKIEAQLENHNAAKEGEKEFLDEKTLKIKEQERKDLKTKIKILESKINEQRIQDKIKKSRDGFNDMLGGANSSIPFFKQIVNATYDALSKEVSKFYEANEQAILTKEKLKGLVEKVIEKIKGTSLYKKLTESDQKELLKAVDDKFDELSKSIVDELPVDVPMEEKGDDGEVWDSVNKEKLKEIKGAKEFYEKETGTTWTDIHQKAMNNLQTMYPNLDLYDAARARVSEIASYYGDKNPYNPTDQDIAVMQWLNHATQSKISEIKGWDSENPIERNSALLQYEDLQKDLDNLVKASHTRQAGTAFGLRGAEMRIDPQYGLKIRRLQYLKAKNGEPLTEGELEETAANWQKEKAVLRKEQELRENAMQEDFNNQIEKLHKYYNEQLSKGKKEKTIKEKGKDLADKIRKIKSPKGTTFIDFSLGTWDLAVEGVAKLVEGGATIAEAIKKMVDEGKIVFRTELDKKQFENTITNSVTRGDISDKIESISSAEKTASITKEMVAKNLIKDYVDSHIGEVEPQDILQTAYDNLKEILPDITQDQVRDAYLKKGDYKLSTKKKVLSDIEQTKQTLAKITKIESDIADLKNKGDIQKKNGEYSKKKQTDKLVEAKQKELKQALIDRGMKVASEDKYTKASYESRTKSHNERIDGLQKEVETLLKDEDLTKSQRTGLLKLNAQLETAKIKLNTDSKFSQEQVVNTGLSRVTNIEKEFRDLPDNANFDGKDKVELKLQQLIDKFNKDKTESEQDIKLQREKDRLKRENQEAQRKLNAMEFADEVPTPLTKSDTELIKLQIEKNQIDAETRRRIKQLEEKNKSFGQKVLETTRAVYVASLIYKFGTLAKVGATTLIRPNIEALTKMTFGNVFKYISPSIAEAAKRGGESSSWRSVKKSYEAYFRQVGEEGMKKIYQKANDKFEKLAKEYNEFEKKVYEIKKDKGEDSVEYKNAEKQLTQLKNAKDDALLSSVGNAMYQVIGGSSLKDALDALVSRSNKIERQFGFLDKESIKDGGKLDKFNYLLGFIGRSHSALKTFSARANYAAGFIARLEGARMDGRNISSPEVLMEIAYDSYIDWDRGKYQQSNFVTDVFNSINNHLENEYKGTKWDKYAKGLSTMLKFDVAITRVPVNILHEAVMEYTLGAFKAMYYGGKEYKNAYKELKKGGILPSDENFKPLLREQISKMNKDQAAMVARCFRKGGFGLGLFALFAITGAISFGGFHRKRDKETGELKVGEIAVGNNDVGDLLSKIIEHQPSMMPTLMGMDFAKMYHDKVVRGESTPEASMDAIMSTLEFMQDQVPQTKIVNPIGITKQVFSGMSRQLGLGSAKGYTNEQLKDPTFQYLDDKNISMSNPMQGNLTDDEYKEFLKNRDDKIKSMWNDAIANGARINNEGNPTIDETVDKRKPIKDLSYDAHKKLMESIERSATEKSKKELIEKNINNFNPKIGETYGQYKVISGNGDSYTVENVITKEILTDKSKQELIDEKYGNK